MRAARNRARVLLPAAMPAIVAVGRPGLGLGDGKRVVVGGLFRLAVVVRVMVKGGWEVMVRVEVMVIVVSALRTLGWLVSVAIDDLGGESFGNVLGVRLIDGCHIGGSGVRRDDDGRHSGDIGRVRDVARDRQGRCLSRLPWNRGDAAEET